MTSFEKSTGYFDSFDKTRIYYEVRGEGTPIVFIYGIACLMNHWHHQITAFSSNHKTLTFDLRGHHKSAVPSDIKNLTIENSGKDLLALLHHLQLGPAHVVGHSFGVPVLLSAYNENADAFRSISLINGFDKNPIKGMFGVDAIEPLFHFVKSQFSQNPAFWNFLWKSAVSNPLAVLGSGLAGGFNLKLTQYKDIEIYARAVSQFPLEIFLPLFEDMMNFDGQDIASKINIPTLIIAGEKDAVTPVKFQQRLHEKIRGSEFFVVPYGSHCTQLDFPDYLNLRLEKFINRVEADAV